MVRYSLFVLKVLLNTNRSILGQYMASLHDVNAAIGQVLSIRRRQTPPPHTHPLGASILTPPILKFCLRY